MASITALAKDLTKKTKQLERTERPVLGKGKIYHLHCLRRSTGFNEVQANKIFDNLRFGEKQLLPKKIQLRPPLFPECCQNNCKIRAKFANKLYSQIVGDWSLLLVASALQVLVFLQLRYYSENNVR
jgi:Ni,Fe-hydrogenase I small subunit